LVVRDTHNTTNTTKNNDTKLHCKLICRLVARLGSACGRWNGAPELCLDLSRQASGAAARLCSVGPSMAVGVTGDKMREKGKRQQNTYLLHDFKLLSGFD